MEQKLISNLSEETLSLSSSLPQAVLCLLNDLIIPLLLFLLILIYYAYALPFLTESEFGGKVRDGASER